MYQTIIFDLDGTLLDTLADIHAALNTTLAAFKLPVYSAMQVRSMVGNGLPELLRTAAPQLDEATHAQALAMLRKHYLDTPHTHTQPYPGIVALLADLKNSGIKLAVLTNKMHAVSVQIVEHFFPGMFHAIQGEQAGLARKPSPAGIERLLKVLHCTISQTVFVGDGETDCRAALAAGMDYIGVSWGFRATEQLMQAGAGFICNTVPELRKKLFSS